MEHYLNICPQCGSQNTCRCASPDKIETHNLCYGCSQDKDMSIRVASRSLKSSDGCRHSYSFAWISPDGKVHPLQGLSHDAYAEKLLGFLEPLPDYPLNEGATATLLNEGWIRAANSFTFELTSRARSKAWGAALKETVDCAVKKDWDPFTHRIFLDWVEPGRTRFIGMTIDEAVRKYAPQLERTLYSKTASSKSTYKKKREVPSADGKGTTTIYEYSERQIANRHKEKADRIEALRKKIPDLRKKVIKDLESEDVQTRMTALAIALIDETYERVGNSTSAKENKHYGVTTWEVSHVKISGGTATIKYTGKSGVDHEKKITDKKVVSCLKKAIEGKKDTDKILCGDECTVDASHVNEYLKPYDITAKDLRGLHANREVQERLEAVRKKGPSLPKDKKEKEKLLKEEFLEALEGAAEAVGHEAATLRSQYLVPGLEENYLTDGSVLKKLNDGK